MEKSNAELILELESCRAEKAEALELARKAADLAQENFTELQAYREGVRALGEDVANAIIRTYLDASDKEASKSSN